MHGNDSPSLVLSRTASWTLVVYNVFMQGPDGSSFAYQSFTRVHPRKKRKGKGRPGDAATPLGLLARVREELETDGSWWACCQETLREALLDAYTRPQKVLCLGLGSPSSSRDARAQLALLGQLCASSDIDAAEVSVYDPVFTDGDRQLFQTLGMRCLDHVQGAEHSLDRPTMLYMPHCDLRLYETVIRANWTLEGLSRIVFVANRFSDYVDNNGASTLNAEAPHLAKVAPFVVCRGLPASGTFPTAFNNISVQYVGRDSLSLQDDTFWESA